MILFNLNESGRAILSNLWVFLYNINSVLTSRSPLPGFSITFSYQLFRCQRQPSPAFTSFKELSEITFLFHSFLHFCFDTHCGQFLFLLILLFIFVLKTFQTFLIIFFHSAFLDLKRVMSFHIHLKENFLLRKLATSNSRPNFGKLLSVSMLLVGKPVSSFAVSLSRWVSCGGSLSVNPYLRGHWDLIPSVASVHMRFRDFWTIALSRSSIGKCLYETRKSFKVSIF